MKKKESFDWKLLIIIFLVLLIIFILVNVYVTEEKETKNDEEIKENNNDEDKIEEKLTINSKIVLDTYKKVPINTLIPVTIYWKDLTNSVYLSTKQTYDTLNKTFIMDNALSFITLKDLNPEPKESNQGPYTLKKSIIEKHIKNIYGDVNFDFAVYNQENGITATGGDVGTGLRFKDFYCNKYVNEEYTCYYFNAGGIIVNETKEYRKLVDVKEDGDYLYLYDYRFAVAPVYAEEGMFTETYSIHVDENAMVGRIEERDLSELTDPYEGLAEIVKDKKIMYKHTFKKDNNNNYYWISTEQEK